MGPCACPQSRLRSRSARRSLVSSAFVPALALGLVVGAIVFGIASTSAAAATLQSQSITFTSQVPAFPGVGAGYSVSATGGASGNPVVFSIDTSTTNQACTLGADGHTVSFAHLGLCVIDANQAGNADYSAAPQVQQSFDTTDLTGLSGSVCCLVIQPGAVVDSVSPDSGAGGTTVNIFGSGLTGKTVFFNAVRQAQGVGGVVAYTLSSIPATTTQVLNDGEIVAVAPPPLGTDPSGELYDFDGATVYITAGSTPQVNPTTGQLSGVSDNEAFYYTTAPQAVGCIGQPPILGNPCTTSRTVPPAVQAFETNAVNEVLAEHDLPQSDSSTVLERARDEVAGQEWIDLASIINNNGSPPSGSCSMRVCSDAAVYRWFQGLYLQLQQGQAQAAVNEYLKWSGLTMDTISDDPQSDGFCNFRPPSGGNNPSSDDNFTDATNQIAVCHIPCTYGMELGGACSPTFPQVSDFQNWGAADVLSNDQGLTAPDAGPRLVGAGAQIGTAITLARAPAGTLPSVSSDLGSDGSLNATGVLLQDDVLPGVLQLNQTAIKYSEAVFEDLTRGVATPSTLIADSVTAANVADVAPLLEGLGDALWITAPVAIVATTVLGSLKLAANEAVHTTLVDALDQANSALSSFNAGGAGPDLSSLIAANSTAVNGLFYLFMSQTLPDVTLDCTGWPVGASARCVTIDPPIPGPSPSDPQFMVIEQGATQSTRASSIYASSPLGPDELTRISGNGWFVTQKYDPSDPNNLNAPDGTPGGTSQDLSFEYKDWQGNAWRAYIVHDTTGRILFAKTPLDPSDLNVCTDAATASSCLSDSLQYTEPNGDQATATIFSSSAPPPTVNASVPTHASAGEPVTLSASAPSLGGGPFLYSWSWKTTDRQGQTVSGGAIGQVVKATFAANPNPWQVTVTAVNLPNGNSASTTSALLSSAPTSLTILASTAAGQPLTGGAPATFRAYIDSDLCVDQSGTPAHPTCLGPTGTVQFFLDGQPLGAPVNVAPRPVGQSSLGVATTPAINDLAATHQGLGHEISAAFYPDSATFDSSSGGLGGIVVNSGNTAVTLQPVVYPTGGSFANPTTLSAHITAGAPSTLAPTGQIEFWVQTWHFAAPVNAGPATLVGSAPIDPQGNATLQGTVLPVVGSGRPWDTLVVYAIYHGDAVYGLQEQGRPFTPTVRPQRITFTATAPTNATVGGPTYTVSAAGGASGNPVIFSIDGATTNSACSLRTGGSTVSFAHAGTCVINANQAGNAGYTAAPQVQQSFTVAKGAPSLTWPTPRAIVFGTKLGSAQLDAAASLPGTFTYSPAAGRVLPPGANQVLSVIFKPKDTADYTEVATRVKINVVLKPTTCITKRLAGPLTIAAGQAYCVESRGTVTGGVTVRRGGALYVTGGTIEGSLTARGATAVTLCGASVGGRITITRSTGPLAIGTCGKNTIKGSVSITSNTGGLTYQNNIVRGSLTITNNSGGFGTLKGNMTTGSQTIVNNH
jgi:hypothetical protein